jgi:hypothetical protein
MTRTIPVDHEGIIVAAVSSKSSTSAPAIRIAASG